jgi:hypothetical protein
VRDLLIEKFAFPPENVRLLVDEKATNGTITREFLRFSSPDVGLDDRIIVFFACHGQTMTGQRGEVGFLIPRMPTAGTSPPSSVGTN